MACGHILIDPWVHEKPLSKLPLQLLNLKHLFWPKVHLAKQYHVQLTRFNRFRWQANASLEGFVAG
eukprot:scaffold33540_cov21-Tisochrysis_lutea.AAC.1